MRSGEGRLRDEDMHINRETSTEMSDHTVNEPTSLYRTFPVATIPRPGCIPPVHLSPSPSIPRTISASPHPPSRQSTRYYSAIILHSGFNSDIREVKGVRRGGEEEPRTSRRR